MLKLFSIGMVVFVLLTGCSSKREFNIIKKENITYSYIPTVEDDRASFKKLQDERIKKSIDEYLKNSLTIMSNNKNYDSMEKFFLIDQKMEWDKR